MTRKIEITEHEDGSASIYIRPEYVKYEFDTFGEALESLTNLTEVGQCLAEN